MQAAAAISMNESTSISRVRSAGSTETKVSGLTTSTREQNLTLLTSVLKNNMEKCALYNPPDNPLHPLVYKDLEDIAIEIEYNCFNTCKAISIYRRNIAKEVHNVKNSSGLFTGTKNHIPQKHKSHGGDYKTIVSDLKDRYGKDVINELEDELQQRNNNSKNSKKSNKLTKDTQSYKDGKTQLKINEFFTKNKPDPDVIEISSQDDDNNDLMIVTEDSSDKSSGNELDDPEIMKLELKKQDLVSELEMLSTNYEKSQDDDIIEIHETKIEQADNNDNFSFDEVRKNSDLKRKIEDPVLDKSPMKKIRMESDFRKASDMLTTTTSSGSENDTEKKRKRNKNKISEIVVNSLNTFYREKKITGPDPKGLFKVMARKITHHFYESDADHVPESKLIKNFVCEIFYNCGVISSEADFKLDD
jgi:hypothetical protein